MLCIGDIPLSVSSGYDVILPDVKPGVWRVVSRAEGHTHLHLAWVSPGPLDVEDLPSVTPKLQSGKTKELEKLGTAIIDSGKLGIIDEDMNNTVLEAVGDEGQAAEALSDPFSDEFVGEFALTGGYVGES